MEDSSSTSSGSLDFIATPTQLPTTLTGNEKPSVFTELLELKKYDDGYQEWKEISRWVKFQETVEPEGNRWSKPHVSTPTLQGWLQLRQHLHSGLILVDVEEGDDFGSICEGIAQSLFNHDLVTAEEASKLGDLWAKKHRHQFEGPRKVDSTLTTVIKELLVQKLESKASLQVPSLGDKKLGSKRGSAIVCEGEMTPPKASFKDGKINVALQKKMPANTEAAIVLEGVVGFQQKPVAVFARLKRPIVLRDLPEVDLPTRFLFFFTGPPGEGCADLYADIGVALSTAFTDKDFIADMYSATSEQDVREALDEYMSGLKILPRNWNTEHKIEPPAAVRKKVTDEMEEEVDEDRRMREASGLVRTGRFFGGLLNDIKRKKPYYVSDFLHGLHPQCISSFLFLYFASLAPIVAFGGLLGEATENRIATIESLISGLICGVLFGLFSGQPLILLGSTGPVYVFEKILYQMCTDQGWDYLSLRLWIGLWVAAILILLVVMDASAYVCYITRFTEELFATLIAFIFIFNAFKNVGHIGQDRKFMPSFNLGEVPCSCEGVSEEYENLTRSDCLYYNGTLVGVDCDYDANVFLMSTVLFVGAFGISFVLKNFRNTGYLPGNVRDFLSDFAVIIGIMTMTGLDYFSGVQTPKLDVPSSFKPTWEGRDWVVTHALIFADHFLSNPWWVDVFLAPVLALLATILIFMDQQITAVIVNRKEFKLKKGGGYHLDLLVLALTIIICSVFGLPWFVAATVLSINHIQSLTKESECAVPGEKPEFLGIREQRVTSVMIGVCVGLSTLITPVLGIIPMPVLFGVFLFMGVSSLKGLQFVERLLLLFIPRKYQPDYVYLKYVPLHRVHMFTMVQLSSLALLWIIKNNPATSISFPVMLVLICAIRKVMECIFSKRELQLLDDLLPDCAGGKNRRRQKPIMRQLSRKISKHSLAKLDWMNSSDSAALPSKEDLLKAKKARLRSQAKELGLELETISFKPKKKVTVTSVAASPSTVSLKKHKVEKPKCTIFVRMNGDEAYMPVHLKQKSVHSLLEAVAGKYTTFRPEGVSDLYQKTTKGMMFHLDDDMIEYMEQHQIFDLQLHSSEGDDNKNDLILLEVERS